MRPEPSLTHRLANGLRIVGRPMPDAESVAVAYYINTGARDEHDPALEGISHFLEHVLFKGTATMNRQQLDQAFTRLGAKRNGFTSLEHTATADQRESSRTGQRFLPRFTERMCFLMSKKAIALLLGIGNGLVIVGVSMVWVLGIYLGVLAGFAGIIVAAVAWIATLVKQAKRHQWGWFTGTLVAWFIGIWLSCSIYILMYLILVPETPHYAPLVSEPDEPAH